MPPFEQVEHVLHPSVRKQMLALARRRRVAEQERRRVIKRSVKLLSRIIGDDRTRTFLQGSPVRFTGRHAIYEMRKLGGLLSAEHGQHALRIIDKDDPRSTLCHLCVYSRNVPLLDHIASLVLHIQTGLEEDILRAGNATDIRDEAFNKDWLRPYLPALRPHRERPRVNPTINPAFVRPATTRASPTFTTAVHWPSITAANATYITTTTNATCFYTTVTATNCATTSALNQVRWVIYT